MCNSAVRHTYSTSHGANSSRFSLLIMGIKYLGGELRTALWDGIDIDMLSEIITSKLLYMYNNNNNTNNRTINISLCH